MFAKLLDSEIGGSFGFDLESAYESNQYYLDNTVVLVTVFSKGEDVFEIHDFMP